MNYFKTEKGSFNYLNKKRTTETIRTVFLFSCAIGLYLIGYITLKTNKSLWTIFAVLSVLPAAKSAVSMIMFFRFSSLSKEEHDSLDHCRGTIPQIYEMVFTTRETSYYIKAIACCDNTIICLLENKSKKNRSAEVKEYLQSVLDREGYNGYSIKIYTDINDYSKRLNEMNSKFDGKNDKSSFKLFNLFKAITI